MVKQQIGLERKNYTNWICYFRSVFWCGIGFIPYFVAGKNVLEIDLPHPLALVLKPFIFYKFVLHFTQLKIG